VFSAIFRLFLQDKTQLNMKRAVIYSFSLLIVALMLVFFSCSRRGDRVREHVEKINFEHQLVINRLDALERALETYIPDIMDKAYEDAVRQLDSSAVVIRSLQPVTPETDLRAEALLLFDTYRILLKNDYQEIVERQKKPAGAFTVADQFLVENLGRLIYNNRKRAKEKYEREAAGVLEAWGIAFSPVVAEFDEDVSSSRKQD
jgi:hypothetical protein